MEGLKELLVKDVTISNRTLRQADALLRGMLEKDANQAIIDLSTLFFAEDASLFPNNFLRHAVEQIAGKNLTKEFNEMNLTKKNQAFWDSEKPNVCSLINFWSIYGNDASFEGKEFEFVEKICKNIKNFPAHSLKVLPKVIEGYNLFCAEHSIDISSKITGLDNDFESKEPISYFATAFLKVASSDVCYESTGVIRFIVQSLVKIYNNDTLTAVFKGNDLSNYLQKHMTAQRFIFFLSELARELNSAEHALDIFNRARDLALSSTDPDVLTQCYNAIALVAVVVADITPKLEECSAFMLRDFNTACDTVRLALCRLFEVVIKRAEKEKTITDVAQFFVDKFIDIPWNSRLKKFVMPTLFRFVKPERSTAILETLLVAAEDQNNKPFVAKCVSSFAGIKGICLSFIEVMIADARKTSETSQLIQLHVLIAPLFHANKDLVAEMEKRVAAVPEHFARTWLRFELTIAAPSVAKKAEFAALLREDMEFGMTSGNWDLRARSLEAFVEAGFPQTDDDCKKLIDNLETLLLTDSTIHQTYIFDAFNEMLKRFSTQTKKYAKINREEFISKVLSIVSKHMASCYIPTQRQFAFLISAAIWRHYPEIGTETDYKLLASLVTDRTFELRQQVISTMRELAKQEKVSTFFASLKSEDVDAFVLRAEAKKSVKLTDKDFPEINNEELRKMKLLLSRNDTSIEPSDFYTKEIIPRLLNEETLLQQHWEVQSEIFAIVSFIISKLRKYFNVSEIEDVTNTIIKHLFNTRKPGLVCSSVETLERLLKVLYFLGNNSVAENLSKMLISQLSGFDMAQMRRSAGLPFLSLALIRSEPASSPLNLFNKLVHALVELVHTTDSSVEAANAMNILKAIVNESEVTAKCEPMYGLILKCIFDACYRFKSWDVISAIDLTIVSFLRKTCNIGGVDAAASTSIIRVQFFSKISESRESILEALRSNCPQANYIALGILELFKPDTGDEEIAAAVVKHLSSKISRMRRVAARALLAVLGITERVEKFKKLASQIGSCNWNSFHGIVLALHEIAKVTDVKGITIPSIALNKIPPMAREDYIFVLKATGQEIGTLRVIQGLYISDEAASLASLGQFSEDMTQRTIVPLLRKWGKQPASKEMLQTLLKSIIDDKVLEMNEAFSINATQFVASKAPRNFIASEELPKILSLAVRAHSVALRAALLSLVALVENPSIEELEKCKEMFIECAIDFSSRMAPVHMSLASITNLLLKSNALLPVVFLLVMNDVPYVRAKVLSAYAEHKGTNVKSENIVIYELLGKITEEAKIQIGSTWVRRLEELTKHDKWGEPMSLFVDELFIARVCIPGLEEASKSIDTMLTITEMRKAFIEIAKQKLN